MCLMSTLSVTLFLFTPAKSFHAVLFAIVRRGRTPAEVLRLQEKADPFQCPNASANQTVHGVFVLSVTTKLFSFIKGVKRPDTATNTKATPETINVGLIPIVSPNHPPKSAPNGIIPVTRKRNAPFILPRAELGVRVCRMVQENTVT